MKITFAMKIINTFEMKITKFLRHIGYFSVTFSFTIKFFYNSIKLHEHFFFIKKNKICIWQQENYLCYQHLLWSNSLRVLRGFLLCQPSHDQWPTKQGNKSTYRTREMFLTPRVFHVDIYKAFTVCWHQDI